MFSKIVTRNFVLFSMLNFILIANSFAQKNYINESDHFTVLKCTWGSGDNNMGKIDFEGEGGIPQGPRTFIFNSEKIYIGDGVNAKVKIFDKNGNLLSAANVNDPADNKIPITTYNIESFTLDDQENIIILKRTVPFDKLKIIKFNNKGKFLNQYLLNMRTTFKYFLEMGADQNLYLCNVSEIYKFSKDLKPLGHFKREPGEPFFFIDKRNMIRYNKKKGSEFKLLRKATESISSLDAHFENIELEFNSNYKYPQLYGMDKEGNYYLYTWFGPGSFFYNIIKLSAKGEYLGKIGIKPSSYHEAQTSVQVADNGDVYVMKSNKDEFWIDCYPADSFSK